MKYNVETETTHKHNHSVQKLKISCFDRVYSLIVKLGS